MGEVHVYKQCLGNSETPDSEESERVCGGWYWFIFTIWSCIWDREGSSGDGRLLFTPAREVSWLGWVRWEDTLKVTGTVPGLYMENASSAQHSLHLSPGCPVSSCFKLLHLDLCQDGWDSKMWTRAKSSFLKVLSQIFNHSSSKETNVF